MGLFRPRPSDFLSIKMGMSKVKISRKSEYNIVDDSTLTSDWFQPRQWCEDKWGMDGGWWRLNDLICFGNEQDLTFYLLKWT